MALNCIQNLVGITEQDCECQVGIMTADEKAYLKLSKTGFYVDRDLEGFPSWVVFQKSFGCNTMYNGIVSAVAGAKLALETEITKGLRDKMKPILAHFAGSLGETTYLMNMGATTRYRGIKISNGVFGSMLNINAIRLHLKTSEAVTVKIIEKQKGRLQSEIYSFDVTTTANSFATVTATEMKLPLSRNGVGIDYYIVYQSVGVPIQNKIDCNCASASRYKSFFRATGGELDLTQIDNEDISVGTEGYAHGLTLDINVKCESGMAICDSFDTDNDLTNYLATAYVFKIGALLISKVLGSHKINIEGFFDREELQSKMEFYEDGFLKNVRYLTQNMDVQQSGCFTCNDANNMYMGNIFIT